MDAGLPRGARESAGPVLLGVSAVLTSGITTVGGLLGDVMTPIGAVASYVSADTDLNT